MPFPSSHDEFLQAVQNHLKEREGCPVLVIVHSPVGLEIQANFKDFSMQMGILHISLMTTSAAFDRQLREGFKSGENEAMVSSIKDAIDPNKKKPN
jgi:hypothetical protein